MASPVSFALATTKDVPDLLPLVEAFHAYEGIVLSDEQRLAALLPLCSEGANMGRIWIAWIDESPVGYLAVCFGYSIEFGGRDAFVDELFVVEAMRGRGIGHKVMGAVQRELRYDDVAALHLEVNRDNPAAQRLYQRMGFTLRECYSLMSLCLD